MAFKLLDHCSTSKYQQIKLWETENKEYIVEVSLPIKYRGYATEEHRGTNILEAMIVFKKYKNQV